MSGTIEIDSFDNALAYQIESVKKMEQAASEDDPEAIKCLLEVALHANTKAAEMCDRLGETGFARDIREQACEIRQLMTLFEVGN